MFQPNKERSGDALSVLLDESDVVHLLVDGLGGRRHLNPNGGHDVCAQDNSDGGNNGCREDVLETKPSAKKTDNDDDLREAGDEDEQERKKRDSGEEERRVDELSAVGPQVLCERCV